MKFQYLFYIDFVGYEISIPFSIKFVGYEISIPFLY